jgi:mxaA protein
MDRRVRRIRIAPAFAVTCAVMALGAPATAFPGGISGPDTQTPNVAVTVVNPRSFGYVVGDTLERRIVLTSSRVLRFESPSLPKLGPQTAWLTLVSATLERPRGQGDHRYEIRLRYQLSNAPKEVRSITLPSLHLRFSDSALPDAAQRTVEAQIEDWHVTIAPIIAPNAPLSIALLRPDRSPQPLSTTPALAAIALSTGLAAAILAALVGGPFLTRRNGPFARAYRTIRGAAARGGGGDADRASRYVAALRALHRAFDETAGWCVFSDRLEIFFAEHPRFADVREATEQFLRMSQREFFAYNVDAEEQETQASRIRWLLEFCRDCRVRERRPA